MIKLYRVVYCSRNRIPGDAGTLAAEITAILAVSRENNARAGITGGLLFSTGCFAQVLEGLPEAVEATFERIQCDDRHNDVILLEAGPITERVFPDWSMAFTGGDAEASLLGASTLASAFSGQSGAGSRVLDVLKAVVVRETRWLAVRPEQMPCFH